MAARRSREFGVVAITRYYPPYVIGGAEVHVQRLSAELTRSGVRCLVLAERCPGMPPLRHFRDKDGVEVHVTTPWGSGHRRSLWFAIDVAAKLFLRRKSFLVVHWSIPGPQALFALPLMHLLGKVNLVRFSGTGQARGLLRTLWGRLHLSALRRFADALIIRNPEMRNELVSLGFAPDRVHLFPSEVNGAAASLHHREAWRASRRIEPDQPVVVYVGRFVKSKRLSDLVAAFSLVVESFPRALLVLGGDGPERGSLQAQVMELKLLGHVLFTGFLEEREVHQLLSAGDLFALVSATEGMPRSLVEAMAAGLPSVVSDIPGITQLVTHGREGRVVPLGDVPAIARAVLDLIQDRRAILECGRQARLRVVPEHTLQTVTLRYLDLYENLLR
jgi:glycosyltransferase involved in cell wall biosynthesis